ncbi:diguanylate cyclase domain-containing protein [Campylobacter sp. MOP7]|uniref:diguanylate cyclase domain-containing protein n=1 Tax=Campylobacter canis TaxID=3378588 RepID=UPI00387E3EF4
MFLYKNKNLSFTVLNKIYFANLITTVAIFCIIIFGISLKFYDVKENLYSNNQHLKNTLIYKSENISIELGLLQRYILSENMDSKTVINYALNSRQECYALYIVDGQGNIKFSTLEERKINKHHREFFASQPWNGNLAGGIYKSEFSFHASDVPRRFIVKELESEKFLISEIKYDFVYEELMQTYDDERANSFIIDKDGKILFHQDIDLVLKNKTIFDLYDVEDDYLSDNGIKISDFGSKNFDIYMISFMPEDGVAVVTYRSFDSIFMENFWFILICVTFLFLCLFFILIDVGSTRDSIVKPILTIKKLIKKVENEESITGYPDSEYIKDFNDIIGSIVKINKDFEERKATYLEYERKFGYLFKKGPLLILLIDLKTGGIIEASSKALEFYGFSQDEMNGKNLNSLNAIDVKDMNIISYSNDDDMMVYETKHRLANSEIKDILISKKSIDLSGYKIGFCIINDITYSNLVKRNLDNENKTNLYSPMFTVSWKNNFLEEILSVSPNSEIVLGYKIEEMLSDSFNFRDIIHPEDFDKVFNEFNIKLRVFSLNFAKKDYESLHVCRLVKKNLEVIVCNIFIKFISKDGRYVDEVIGYFINNELISRIENENTEIQKTIELSKKRTVKDYRAIAHKYKNIVSNLFLHSKEGIAIVSTDAKFIDVNDAFTEITGFSKEESIGSSTGILKSGVHDQKFYSSLWKKIVETGYWSGNIWNKRKNGEKYLEFLTISAIYNGSGGIEYFLAIFSDITRMKAREDRLEQIAYYDPLTKLPNRFLFSRKLEESIRHAIQSNTFLMLVYIDIDDFKPINDLYGHTIGDQFLIEATRNINSVIKSSDTLARIGGDEFVAIIGDLYDKKQVEQILNNILRAANKDIFINYKRLKVSVSIGVSLYPQKTEVKQDILLEQADWAMYQSKLSGKNKYYIFNPVTDKNFRDYYAVADRIATSLTNNDFLIVYQPIINIKTGKISSIESFIKWKSNNSSILSDEILPVVSKDYIYDDLVIWNIKNVLRDQSILAEDYGLNLKISINVTLELLYKMSFIEKFKLLLESENCDNINMIEFNINNSNSFKQPEDADEILDIYIERGITFALDEFGSNSASLQILKDIYADRLKVSKYLSLSAVNGADSLIILRTILTLSNAFSKDVIAKGVETAGSMSLLIKAGYENLQGGYITPPIKFDSIQKWYEGYKIPEQFKKLKALSETDMIWCNLAVMHRVWIRSLLDMLSSKNLAKFDTEVFAKEYSNAMISSYKKHIEDTHKVAIHVEISDIIMNILTNLDSKQDISKLVLNLKTKRDKLLDLE